MSIVAGNGDLLITNRQLAGCATIAALVLAAAVALGFCIGEIIIQVLG